MDLGLPSGIKWRRYNLGADSPEKEGLYCSWGNIEGHAADSGYAFTQDLYNNTPAVAINTDLTDEQDIAHVYLGGSSRLPKTEDLEELLANTTSIWTTYNGIYGRLFTSNINGEVLFMPAVGYIQDHRLQYGILGMYWTRSLSSAQGAHNLNFRDTSVNPLQTFYRYCGCAIRPIWDENPNRSVINPHTSEDEPKVEETPTTEEPKDNNER